MKKLSILFYLGAILVFLAGCVKDEGFDDQQYGIDIGVIKAVAFTQAAKSPVVVGITGQAAPVIVTGPLLTLEDVGPAQNDVHITIQYDQALVTAQGLTPLPAGTFSISSLAPVIKGGSQLLGDLKLTVTNSDVLDPNLKYGVGFKIVSVDEGYQIAKNMSTVVIGFAIKNKYDGVYLLKGYHNRSPYDYPYETEIHLITTGPTSVAFYWPEVKDYGHPIGVGAGNSLSWYGNGIQPVIEFDKATDLVKNVYNAPPNATPITMFTGAGSRVSKYDPATKAITVDWNYNNNAARAFFDNLTYISPRP